MRGRRRAEAGRAPVAFDKQHVPEGLQHHGQGLAVERLAHNALRLQHLLRRESLDGLHLRRRHLVLHTARPA